MSEQEMEDIVQITVEDFNPDDQTGKILVTQCENLIFLSMFSEFFFLWIFTFSAFLTRYCQVHVAQSHIDIHSVTIWIIITHLYF